MQGIELARLRKGINGDPLGNAALNLRVTQAKEVITYIY
jgi:hypothetical protein